MCTAMCIFKLVFCEKDFPQHLHLKLVLSFFLFLVCVEALQTNLASSFTSEVLSRVTCSWGRRGLTGSCATLPSPGAVRRR